MKFRYNLDIFRHTRTELTQKLPYCVCYWLENSMAGSRPGPAFNCLSTPRTLHHPSCSGSSFSAVAPWSVTAILSWKASLATQLAVSCSLAPCLRCSSIILSRCLVQSSTVMWWSWHTSCDCRTLENESIQKASSKFVQKAVAKDLLDSCTTIRQVTEKKQVIR